MKKSVILGGLLALSMFGLMGMGGNKEEAVKPTVGIVQTVQVYEQSKLAKLATERLEKLQSEAMARLEAMQKEMSAEEAAHPGGNAAAALHHAGGAGGGTAESAADAAGRHAEGHRSVPRGKGHDCRA